MTLLAQVRAGTRPAARRLVLAIALSGIGLVVGFGCVLLPAGFPFGIVALAGLVLLWVMPDLQVVPERLMRVMYYPFIVSVLSVPTYYALVFPGVPWISVRRAILFAFIAPTVITITGSSRHRAEIMETLRSCKPLLFCLAGLTSMIVLSTLLSSRTGASINTTVNTIMVWFIPLIATLMLARTERSILIIMRVIVACVCFDFLIGLIEFYLKHPFLFSLLPAFMRDVVLSSNPLYITLITGQGLRSGAYRASSIFNISLSWGEMAAMMLPICAHFLAHGRTRGDRVYGAVGTVAAIGSILCAGSRGGFVSGLAAAMAFIVLWAMRQQKERPQALWGGIALTLCSMAAMTTFSAVLFVQRIHNMIFGGGEAQASTDARYAEWDLAKPRILESPLWGYGPGTSADVVGYLTPGGIAPTVDSFLITSLVEWGIPGFLFFFGLLITAIYVSFRIYLSTRSQLSALGLSLGCSLLAFTIYRITLSQQENMTPMLMVVGLVISLQHCLARMPSARTSGLKERDEAGLPAEAFRAQPKWATAASHPSRQWSA